MPSRAERNARQARKAADRLERRIDHEAAQLRAVRVAHYNGSHLIRADGDVTLCRRPARDPKPADSRYDKPCMRCADAAKALLR